MRPQTIAKGSSEKYIILRDTKSYIKTLQMSIDYGRIQAHNSTSYHSHFIVQCIFS